MKIDTKSFTKGWEAGIRHANQRAMLGHNPEHMKEEMLKQALKENP